MKLVVTLLCLSTLAHQALSQTTPQPNCPAGKCAKCEYTGQGYSCLQCYYSKRFLAPKTEGQTKDHFGCTEKNDITLPDCISLEQDQNTGESIDFCYSCQKTFYLKPDTKTCERIQNFNCITAELDQDNIPRCTICNEGMSVQDGDCKKIPSDQVISNCRYHGVDSNKNPICAVCKDQYYEGPDSKTCIQSAEATRCIKGIMTQGDGCADCMIRRDYWATAVFNNYNDRQVCVYTKTGESKKDNHDLVIPLYFWYISLVVVVFGICVIQCIIFGSRKHLYAENKPDYKPKVKVN